MCLRVLYDVSMIKNAFIYVLRCLEVFKGVLKCSSVVYGVFFMA